MPKSLIAFDSCTILHLLAPGPWQPHIHPIYEKAQGGDIFILVSELSIAECCKLKCPDGSEIAANVAKSLIGGFFDRSFVKRHSATDVECWLAAEYKRSFGFKTCDAIIAATAAIAGADAIITTDGCPNPRPKSMLGVGSIVRPDGGAMKMLAPDKYP